MSEKILNNKEIDFLIEISRALMEQAEPTRIAETLTDTFKLFFPVEKITFSVWDETASQLRDFAKEWISFEKNERTNLLLDNFNILRNQTGQKFLFNKNLVDFKPKRQDCETLRKSISQENNMMYFPLIAKERIFGLVEIKFGELNENSVFNTNFFGLLQLSLIQISSAILNHILKDQMETGLNFYEAMKDIAKIIESQYELTYIIPLIGEMIDRFISAHLIYIFLKDKEGKFELLWPNACKDKEVMFMLEQINIKTEYIITDNRKIGVFPLISENNILGAIVAYSNIDKLNEKEIEYLSQLSKQSSATIQRANVYAEVLKYATLDALTGLNNRRQFETRLNQEIATAKRKKNPLCCMMLDVDYFKKVNDTYGHAAGDCVLKAVSQLITKEIREYDIASRYGGEEFFILLPQTTLEEASFVAQRLRKTIEESKMDISEANVPNKKFLNITVSIGVSDFSPTESCEEFYHNADKALYEAKNRGRNKVVVFNRSCDCPDDGCKI